MFECRHCGEYFRMPRESLPSRCPRCREPLFERAGGPVLSDEQPPERGICAMHPGNNAIGTCKECGNFFCPVCRTRWKEQALCLACVERALSGEGTDPEQRRSHARQAVLSCVLGVGAWVMLLLSIIPVLVAASGQFAEGNLILAVMLIVVGFFAALLGLGQGVTAVRFRGHRLIAATCGLLFSGSYVGVLVGLFLIQAVRH